MGLNELWPIIQETMRKAYDTNQSELKKKSETEDDYFEGRLPIQTLTKVRVKTKKDILRSSLVILIHL